MDKRNAAKLHNEDEVLVKSEGNRSAYVVETNVVRDSETRKIKYVEVMLTNGNWYNHKDLL